MIEPRGWWNLFGPGAPSGTSVLSSLMRRTICNDDISPTSNDRAGDNVFVVEREFPRVLVHDDQIPPVFLQLDEGSYMVPVGSVHKLADSRWVLEPWNNPVAADTSRPRLS